MHIAHTPTSFGFGISAPSRTATPGESPHSNFAATLGNAMAETGVMTVRNEGATPNTQPRQPDDEPQLFFPPNFPIEIKKQLTDFMRNSSLSSEEKNALWATTVVSIDLMNNGPAEFRRQLSGNAGFGSENFDPLRLLDNYASALSAKYPRIGAAMNDYLKTKGHSPING